MYSDISCHVRAAAIVDRLPLVAYLHLHVSTTELAADPSNDGAPEAAPFVSLLVLVL